MKWWPLNLYTTTQLAYSCIVLGKDLWLWSDLKYTWFSIPAETCLAQITPLINIKCTVLSECFCCCCWWCCCCFSAWSSVLRSFYGTCRASLMASFGAEPQFRRVFKGDDYTLYRWGSKGVQPLWNSTLLRALNGHFGTLGIKKHIAGEWSAIQIQSRFKLNLVCSLNLPPNRN